MTSAVMVALRIAAPPERVFAAFTEEIGVWWRPNALFAFTPRPPGKLAFEPGIGGRFTETLANGKVFEIGRITVWSPPTHLAFTWRQATFPLDCVTDVDVRFEPADGGTRVTVTHRGWDRVPDDNAAKHRFPEPVLLKHCAEHWRAELATLAAALSPSP